MVSCIYNKSSEYASYYSQLQMLCQLIYFVLDYLALHFTRIIPKQLDDVLCTYRLHTLLSGCLFIDLFYAQNLSICQNPTYSRSTLNTSCDFQAYASTHIALHRLCGKCLQDPLLKPAIYQSYFWPSRVIHRNGRAFPSSSLEGRACSSGRDRQIHLSAIPRFPWKMSAPQREQDKHSHQLITCMCQCLT